METVRLRLISLIRHNGGFSTSDQGPYSFEAPGPTRGFPVTVNVFPAEMRAEATCDYAFDTEGMALLTGVAEPTWNAFEAPEAAWASFEVITLHMTSAVNAVLEQIKYCLNWHWIDEQLAAHTNVNWSRDGATWNAVPTRGLGRGGVPAYLPLDGQTSGLVQDAVARQCSHITALRYLHRARRELEGNHKWIDATIAAELAIKEVLMMVEPKLATLLLELPSPPLRKLYGPSLKHYTQQNCPNRAKLVEGAEKRNELVHRPGQPTVGYREAADYVDNVEQAIYFLLTLVSPKEPWITAVHHQITEWRNRNREHP